MLTSYYKIERQKVADSLAKLLLKMLEKGLARRGVSGCVASAGQALRGLPCLRGPGDSGADLGVPDALPPAADARGRAPAPGSPRWRRRSSKSPSNRSTLPFSSRLVTTRWGLARYASRLI